MESLISAEIPAEHVVRAEEGIEKMKAQTEWAFAYWKSRPAIWSEVAAFSFEKSEWFSASAAEVGTEGRTRTKASLEMEFGILRNIPPFPSEEAAAAFQIEEKRLRRM